MTDCPSVLTTIIMCRNCGHRWRVVYGCPIPPAQHARTPIPDARIACPKCGKSRTGPEHYWRRLDQVPA